MNKIYRINDIQRNLKVAGFYPLDVLVIGGTGAGKSSTINSLFQKEVTKIGRGCEPETMAINSLELNKWMRFWDSPGMGDSVLRDKTYSKELKELFYRDYHMDGARYGLIDTTLVIVDGSGRDMGTTYNILSEIVVPNIQTDRILVAINQADMAMKGRHWNEDLNCPDEILLDFLEKKAASITTRVKEATGITIAKPVYYSAEKEYNIQKLLDMIIDNIPSVRRKLVG